MNFSKNEKLEFSEIESEFIFLIALVGIVNSRRDSGSDNSFTKTKCAHCSGIAQSIFLNV